MLTVGELRSREPSLYQEMVGGGYAERSSPHLSRKLRPTATLRCGRGRTTGADTESKEKKCIFFSFLYSKMYNNSVI
jgi:hypothetical protein